MTNGGGEAMSREKRLGMAKPETIDEAKGTIDHLLARTEKAERERDEALRAYKALGKLDSANTDALGLAEATIKRIEALRDRWKVDDFDDGLSAFDMLEAVLRGKG